MRTDLKKTISYSPTREQGFSLVELIVYIAILAIVVSALTLTAVSLLRSFAYARASGDVAEAATVALERLTREIRFAHTVQIGTSVLGTHPGTLGLETTDLVGNPATLLATLNSGRIMLAMNGGTPAPLTRASVTVTNLVFTHMPGTEKHGVRIDLTIERAVRDALISKDFRTYVVLDAS
jgi:prepilin-type N-terminal cleavage/methylation domain-containing protein